MYMKASTRTGFPPQIKYIIGNEACERFSYYGMRSILVIFMVQYLMMPEHEAKGIYHLFISANYFTPILGGYLADRYLGKYKTIMYLSMVYCLGHAVLALWESKMGMYAGLGLIALGAGGIKPCVSAHVGDQFDKSNSHLMQKVYELFYFSINFGSFFSTLLIPWILPRYGASLAFGIPGILMAVATYVFWLGRKEFIIVPPTGADKSPQFWGVLFHGLRNMGSRRPGESFLDTAKAKYGEERVEGAKATVSVFKVLVMISAFWALFEQHGGSWILQAKQMNLNFFGMHLEAAQIAALNPIMVMCLIPLFSFVIYPAVEKIFGWKMTPIRRIGVGMFVTAASFGIVGFLQVLIDQGQVVNIGWQAIAWLVLTMAEVLVSITGLEFAYTQAPPAMKSTIMSLFLLTVTIGNLFTSAVSFLNPFKGSGEFFFYAGLMTLFAGFYVVIAMRYKDRNYVGTYKPT